MGETMTTEASAGSNAREPELLGQTVVLIGGSAGIGLETARRARSEGADVVLTGRDPGRLERAASDVDARSTAAFDATDAAALKQFFDGLPDPIDHVLVTGPGPTTYPCSRWTQLTCARRSAATWCWGSRSRATPAAR
jgi:NAD(P)-dependent dehydrogenase (short-subunit alcohol dehydrogenase family)